MKMPFFGKGLCLAEVTFNGRIFKSILKMGLIKLESEPKGSFTLLLPAFYEAVNIFRSWVFRFKKQILLPHIELNKFFRRRGNFLIIIIVEDHSCFYSSNFLSILV